MGNMCLYETMHGYHPSCSGACKKGKDNHCEYYFVDPICEIMYKWRKEANIEEPVMIKYDYNKETMFIYTTKPGWFIGYHGRLYDKYYPLLHEKLRTRFINENGPTTKKSLVEFIDCDDVIGA